MDKKELMEKGISYDEGVNRFCGAEALYQSFLKKYLNDETFEQLRQAMEKEDYQAAFSAAHTLKGVTGNLSLTALYEQVVPFVELLRNGKDITGAKAAFPAIEECYAKTIDVIRQI